MVTKPSSLEEKDPAVRAASAVRSAGERGRAVPKEQHGDRRRRTGRAAVAEPPVNARRQRLRTTLELIRANPTGRVALKIFIAVAGALVVTLGIALIPLPGPGWLLVIAGLG